jgi:hypothetical protein
MGDIPELERITFYQGELLRADDLTTLDSNNQELRWLHNRSLHNWGIGFGLDVQGSTGATSVTVNPGYATDISGHEIILPNPLTLPIPAISSASYYLVANWVDDADEAVVQQNSATACNPGGSVRLSDAPAIVWKTVAQLAFGTDVILCLITIQNCVLSQISTAVRRYATCGSMFYLKAGSIDASTLTWSPWMLEAGVPPIGLTAAIDTSAAKFQTTPSYIAQIAGSRLITTTTPPTVIVDFVTVNNPSTTGFTLQVVLPGISAVTLDAILEALGGPNPQLNWIVNWMGVQG